MTFRLLQFDDVPLKMRRFSIFSPFNFKQWFQNFAIFEHGNILRFFFNQLEPLFVCEEIFCFAKKQKRKENEEK